MKKLSKDLSAICLSVMVLLTVSVKAGEILEFWDFETGDYTQTRSQEPCQAGSGLCDGTQHHCLLPCDCGVGTSLKVVSSLDGHPARSGVFSSMVYHQPCHERAELTTGRIEPATENWYKFSIYVPEDFDQTGSDPGWTIVSQFHNYYGGQPEWLDGAPSILMIGSSGTWRFKLEYNDGDTQIKTSTEFDLGSPNKGEWADFVVHVYWTNQQDGFFQMWRDGVKYADYTGPTYYNIPDGAPGPYFKLGSYKGDPWKGESPLIIYNDAYYRGRGYKSLGEFLEAINEGPRQVEASSYEQVAHSGVADLLPELTIDEDESDLSRWGAEGDGEWILYDLGGPRFISSLDINFFDSKNRQYTFDVEVATAENGTWMKVVDMAESKLIGGYESILLNQTVQFVRITGHGNTHPDFSGWIHIKEVMFSSASHVNVDNQTYKVRWLEQDDFSDPDWASQWVLETGTGKSGATAEVVDGALVISDPSDSEGATLWYDQSFPENFIVRYTVEGDASRADNELNFNHFTNATERDGSPVLFNRDGDYEGYHEMSMYLGTFTRDGSRLRFLPPFDNLISDSQAVHAQPGVEYEITQTVLEGFVTYFINGEKIHEGYLDHGKPGGYFALHTWHTTAKWDNFEFGEIVNKPGEFFFQSRR